MENQKKGRLARFVLLPFAFCLVLPSAVALSAGDAAPDAQSYVSRVNRGTDAMNKKDYVKAVKLLSEAENSDPSRPQAPAALGWAFYNLKLYEDGLAAFERALAKGETPMSLHGAAFCNWELRRYQDMLARAERWSAVVPDDPQATAAVGLALLYNGRFDEAIPPLERAGNVVRSAMFDAWLAEAYLATNRYAEADRVAARGLTAAPSKYEAWLLERVRGLAAVGRGDFEGARRTLDGPTLALGLAQQADRKGLGVRWIVPGGPADRGGVRPGDVIRGFDNERDMSAFTDLVFDTRVRRTTWGRTMVLRIERDGALVNLPVSLTFEATPPPEAPPAASPAEPAGRVAVSPSVPALTLLGIKVAPARVKQGQAFRVTVSLLLRASTTTPVTLQLSIVQAGQALGTTTVETRVPPGEPWEVVKEIPRAAGDPGLYTVEVVATAGTLEERGEGLMEIVGR